MHSYSYRAAAWRAGCLLVLLTAVGCQNQQTGTPGKTTIDPEARKVLDEFGKYVSGLTTYSVTCQVNLQVTQDGRDTATEFTQKLQVEHPNKLVYALEAPTGTAQIVSDGSEVAIYLSSLKKYLVEKSPATLEGIFQNQLAMSAISPGNATLMTLSLLSSEPATGLASTASNLKYGGLVLLDGVQCHLIEATGDQLDWKLWIDAGERPLPRKFVPDLSKAVAKMIEGARANDPPPDIKVTNTAVYSDWQVNEKLDADAFVFHAPDDVERADSMAQLLGGAQQEDQHHPLLGQAAPQVELDLLGGGKLDLAALKDNNIVILDFWATWCGPCQKAMPIIEKVATAYKDKGVLLYAVDLEEPAEEVQKFVDEQKLKVTIALDKDGAVSKAYKADAIPQTVIVAKDGTVQVVHVGLLPDLEAQLTKELDALVEGKTLAAPPVAKGAAADATLEPAAAAPAEVDAPAAEPALKEPESAALQDK